MQIMWVALTIMAAWMQAWRNAFQKKLSHSVDVYGVTLARFMWAWPLAGLYLYYHQQQADFTAVDFSLHFYGYVVIAGLSQIVATLLMVQLFKQKNYAIGVGLAKSEAILAALIAVVFLSEQLSLGAMLGVLIGAVAVFLLSRGTSGQALSYQTLLIGIGSGLSFAITSILVREASLELTPLQPLHRAAWVLCSVIGFQSIVLTGYLALFRRNSLIQLWQQPSLSLKVSLCSFMASLGWFSAMSLQSVALVKTLGQIEILFSLLISVWIFKEKLAKSDLLGLFLVVLAALLVIWA